LQRRFETKFPGKRPEESIRIGRSYENHSQQEPKETLTLLGVSFVKEEFKKFG
jgi:hypothetical protein